jgi:hypothetical protein
MEARTIDITPTWESSVAMLLIILEHAETEGAKDIARKEIRAMAKLADLYVQSTKGGA